MGAYMEIEPSRSTASHEPIPGLIAAVRRDGRRLYTPHGKAAVIAQCTRPGASMAGVALAHGINPNIVRKWVVDAQAITASTRVANRLLPVQVVASVQPEPKPAASRSTMPTVSCEVVLARGTLRLSVDAQGLRQVIDALSL
jgi:transposase-like protein